tara:strand:+ start:783 stop:1391 length:609 start_codon:yes stop_codon:yes gene_type:complete
MDLSHYKKAWENQPEEKNKISDIEIYKMTQSKSISIVKWIFIIGILEFIVLNSVAFFVDLDAAHEEYSKIGLKNFIIYSEIIAHIIAAIFVIIFYLNYRSINTVESTKNLMSKILKTRKTVKLYVLFNLVYMFFFMIVVIISVVQTNLESLTSKQMILFVIGFAIFCLIVLVLVWLFYQLLYGILLRKLNKNYKSLSELEVK